MFRRAIFSVQSRLPRQSAVMARRMASTYRAAHNTRIAASSLVLAAAGVAVAVQTQRAEAAAPAVDYTAVRKVSSGAGLPVVECAAPASLFPNGQFECSVEIPGRWDAANRQGHRGRGRPQGGWYFHCRNPRPSCVALFGNVLQGGWIWRQQRRHPEVQA